MTVAGGQDHLQVTMVKLYHLVIPNMEYDEVLHQFYHNIYYRWF
jgi:hypothetical protein